MRLFTILNYIIWFITIFTLISIIGCYYIYKYTINKFSKNYDNLVKILKTVKNNDLYFMNFGYWEDKHMSLTNANKKLCDFVFNKCCFKKNTHILDVGCGYGEQDIYWSMKNKHKITAIDISKKQIDFAKQKANDLSMNNITFVEASATKLPFEDKTFSNIICLESAFHYNPRKEFFKESYRVLKDESELVIADIMLKNSHYGILTSVLIKFFKELFSVPEENLINTNDYVKQLEDVGYKVERISITDKTFKPYFINFAKTQNYQYNLLGLYNKGLNLIVNNIDLIPFEYYVFICKK
jgi:ubiquinone/menaquinone biosynthesis C-methylase UbiE